MKNTTKAFVYNSLALLLAVVALLTASLWAYYFNLFTALPALIGAYILCRLANGAVPENSFSKVNYALMVAAVLVGLVMLLLLLLSKN